MFEQKTEKKCALFLADGCEEVEALSVADMLFRAGIPTSLVSVGETPVVRSSHAVTIVADMTVSELRFDDYDMLILPGGLPGTTNLGACRPLTDALVRFAGEGRMIAAICAAPTVFAGLGLLKGRPATCHPSCDEKLAEGGALLTHDPVVVSGNIITSRGVGTALDFGLAIVAHYVGQAEADRIAKSIVLR